jgi:hypothetical protein
LIVHGDHLFFAKPAQKHIFVTVQKQIFPRKMPLPFTLQIKIRDVGFINISVAERTRGKKGVRPGLCTVEKAAGLIFHSKQPVDNGVIAAAGHADDP